MKLKSMKLKLFVVMGFHVFDMFLSNMRKQGIAWKPYN
jgi:hypothetical protein